VSDDAKGLMVHLDVAFDNLERVWGALEHRF
jgi:hypothetical protein